MRRSTLLSMLLAFACQGAGAETVQGLHFVHHDWEIACDNTRTCRAAGYQPEGEPWSVSLLLTREGGPDSPVRGQLQIGLYDGEPPGVVDGVLAVELEIDGKTQGRIRVPMATGIADLPDALAGLLLRNLPGSSTIRFVGGERTWTLSDRGAHAVLLKMDDFQGRLGTPGALVRRGEGDEEAVPSALPVPTVIVPPISGEPLPELAADATLLAALRAMPEVAEDCNAFDEAIEVIRLDAHHARVSTLCWRAAYNEGYAVWLIDTLPPFRPRLVTTSAGEVEGARVVAMQKGRGLADCLSAQTWNWDGRAIVLTAASTTGMCKMVAAGGAWELPTLVSEVRGGKPRD